MSVRIRLNNKRFLGESLLIGSRLNEGEVQQLVTNGQTAAPANGQATGQPAVQQATPANGQTVTPTNNVNVQNANVQNQQGNVAQQLQQVYVKHFQGLQAAIANDLNTIQGVQWAQNVQPKDQSFNSIMTALQEYMKANVEAAKKAVEASAQQQNNNNQSNTQNSSTSTPAQ